jgi:hypothetical protein
MPISELKLAKELISKPSITPKDAGAINVLAKNLRSIGFKCQLINFKNIKNLYAKLGSSSPNFCYAGHTDVVPPGNIKDWSTNPFKPTVKNNKLIGRGANDMKSSIACFVAAISRFKAKNKKFKGSISLLITGDEEGVAINGTKRVVEYLKRKKEKINFCLLGFVGSPTKQKLIFSFFLFKYSTTLFVPLIATPSSSPVINKLIEPLNFLFLALNLLIAATKQAIDDFISFAPRPINLLFLTVGLNGFVLQSFMFPGGTTSVWPA